MLIYPAIDICEGKCVRLRQGDYAGLTVYSDSPLEVARTFLANGFNHLHLVDLEAAREGRPVNRATIESILALAGVQAQVGGGIRERKDIQRLCDAGAHRVVLGSVAVQFPDRIRDWVCEFTSERLVVAVDVKGDAVAHSGWLENAHRAPSEFLGSMVQAGVTHFLCTRIERDGMLQGPDFVFYSSLLAGQPRIQLIASGGVSCLADIEELGNIGCAGVIIGKALYEGRVKLEELAGFREC